jgi:hypothetical protein
VDGVHKDGVGGGGGGGRGRHLALQAARQAGGPPPPRQRTPPAERLFLVKVDEYDVQYKCTVRKKDLILRSIERRLQMQFSMAGKFPLWPLPFTQI